MPSLVMLNTFLAAKDLEEMGEGAVMPVPHISGRLPILCSDVCGGIENSTSADKAQ